LFWLSGLAGGQLTAAEPAPPDTGLAVTYNVHNYVIEGKPLLPAGVVGPLLARHTGANVSLREIVTAAYDLESACRDQGLTTMNVLIAPNRIAAGVVPLTVFRGAIAQILVAGKSYPITSEAQASLAAMAPQTTNAAARSATTNAGPHFTVEKYLVLGNTVLPAATVGKALAHVEGAYGTNVSFAGIRAAASTLQSAYRDRGYVTVAVTLPRQKLTNGIVKLQVTEGRLAAIDVKGNRYFSSNNVLSAMPSLHTNIILNSQVFQAELNQANASQDRQIYPQIGPGPEPGTTALTLDVKDRFPLHAKTEFNNESSPGTPDLRVNSSASYDNLFQLNQSLGIQYSFSPEESKQGSEWNFYDRPLVANYSGFYRIPLGGPSSVEQELERQPGSFGYDEATHRFNLPPASDQPEITFFASQSTIDTGLTATPLHTLFATTNPATVGSVINTTLKTDSSQQDLTVNNDLGFRLSMPLAGMGSFHQSVSGGLDFKSYQVSSAETNNFYLNSVETVYETPPIEVPISSTNYSTVPYTVKYLEYLPLNLRYDANWQDRLGAASAGLGLSVNVWSYSITSVNASGVYTYYHGAQSIQQITGSKESSGYWAVLTPSFSQQLELVTNWPMTLRADGQWASEPLISNEQFGIGGVNSVRGYHEGEVFGDNGWHVSFEQDTPGHLVGPVYGTTPLILRGSVYMDYARAWLIDPQPGSAGSTALWGTGFGMAASIGYHWEARFLFTLPLLDSPTVAACQPYFNFALTAQF
jgi:hemolysin activation/secretion protein